MRGIKAKLFLRLFRKTALPILGVGICVCITLGAMECFGGFFEKLTVISAAAAMPQGGISVGLSELRGSSDEKTQSAASEGNLPERDETQEISSTVLSEVPQSSVEVPKDAGKISEYAITPSKTSSKIIWYEDAAFSNTSKFSNNEILKVLKQNPTIKLKEGKPQVLIYHTHSTESYEMQDLGYYEKGSSARTTDERYNMIRVGDEIAAQLEKAGIEVIHIRELYDYPSYNGAYNRSAETVKKYLEKYPSITVTLDIHRDAIEQADGTRVKPTATVNGKKAAQVMIIAGVDDGTMDFPKWRENMKFASALQRQMEQSFSGLTRAAMVCHRRYNMYLTTNSLLIEVGGHANTLDEAIFSGEMIGKSLVDVLKEYGTD
ncbi:MAG: stage II sporulation protein P [Oscillospiraceae bacterium]|nr:stage II sporulation protein P [Oscillospiraceae bacterium]